MILTIGTFAVISADNVRLEALAVLLQAAALATVTALVVFVGAMLVPCDLRSKCGRIPLQCVRDRPEAHTTLVNVTYRKCERLCKLSCLEKWQMGSHKRTLSSFDYTLVKISTKKTVL